VESRDTAATSGISTTSGVILGHAAANRTGVTEYLGIPYAASTSGSQRWLPPQRFTSNQTFNASTYVSLSKTCPSRGKLLITSLNNVGPVQSPPSPRDT
jgi:carboxylesterase type B